MELWLVVGVIFSNAVGRRPTAPPVHFTPAVTNQNVLEDQLNFIR